MRGAGAQALRGCFADVQLLPEIDRGAGRGTTPYTVLWVAGPLRDVERVGCYRPPHGEVLIRPVPEATVAGRRSWNFPAKA